MMAEAKLRGGVIFGDRENGEYVYLPASEVGASRPLCVYEIGRASCRERV